MRRETPVVMILVLGLMLLLCVGIYAQVKKDTKSGLDRIEGTIQALNKEKGTLNITQTSSKTMWKVTYNDQTKFTKRNTPAKLEDLKEGQRVIVLGKYEHDTLMAARIDMRTEK